MKNLIFLAAMLLLRSTIALNQSKEEQVVFDYAGSLYEEEKYAEAAQRFAKFMTDFPKSPIKPRAHFNLAISYLALDDLERAKATFEEILNESYDDRDANDLMEPYTLYKHHSCRHLAMIALRQKNYDDAEKFIGMFDKKYPYQHFCGNEWAAYDNYKAVMLAKVYANTGRAQKAMETLVPYMFYNGLASNQNVINAMIEVLEQHFNQDEVRARLMQALASVRISRNKHETSAVIRLFDVNVNVAATASERDKSQTLNETYFQNVVSEHPVFKRFKVH